LAIIKSNLEDFLLSLVITIIFYFYSTLLLNAKQIQIQKNLIKRILLTSIFSYLLPLLLIFCIVIKESEKSAKSRFTIKQKNNKYNKNKWRKKEKVVKERKSAKKDKK